MDQRVEDIHRSWLPNRPVNTVELITVFQRRRVRGFRSRSAEIEGWIDRLVASLRYDRHTVVTGERRREE